MTTAILDIERRALLEHHAKQLLQLTEEKKLGFGLVAKSTITRTVDRMKVLAEELEQ